MKRNSESGFALLFIYAMAATVAIMLYMELPRVAFEAQRDKEQLLIDRGEQYSRAITLYVRKFNRYPPDFEALDNTQNMHFLRGHYPDPITGKNEWRLIHVGPGGVFTDSLLYNKKKDDKSAPQNFITEAQQVGGNQVDPTQGVNLAARTRPSDQPGAAGDPNNPQTALPPGQFAPTGQLPPGVVVPPGMPQIDANGQFIPNSAAPGVNGQGLNGQAVNGQGFNGQPPFGQPFNGQPANGQQPQQNVPAGVNLINQLLTTPRPGGLNGLNGQNGFNGQNGQVPAIDQYGNPVPTNPLTGNLPGSTGTTAPTAAPAPQAPAATTIGGGIAGVASKREQEGIKVYNDKTKYNEWEFVYDISKDKSRGAVTIPQPAAPAAAPQTGQLPTPNSQQQQQQIPAGASPLPGMPVAPPSQ